MSGIRFRSNAKTFGTTRRTRTRAIVSSLLALAVLVSLLAAVGIAPPAAAEQASSTDDLDARLDAGGYHTCAVLDDGTVRCWGYNDEGELGYGNTDYIGDDETPDTAGPVNVGAGRTATAIAAGGSHTCALLDDGTVRCWGYNGDGELGYGYTDWIGDDETADTAGPVDLGAGRTATAISAGDAHTCALLDDGTVLCWGANWYGQLGYGNADNIGDDETPGTAGPVDLGAGRTATVIAVGDYHGCAVLDDGTVRCWGFNDEGELGYGNTDYVGDDETPSTAGPVDLGAGRTATAISAGAYHTCAVLDDGTVRCWGFNGNGELGYGNTDWIGDDETPDTAGPVNVGVGRSATAISAGGYHTCASLDDGTVRCWGYNGEGELGYGDTDDIGDDETPDTAGPVAIGLITRPTTAPDAPTTANATAGNAEATVSWTAPASDGGDAITGYSVTVSPTTGVTGATTRTAGAGDTTLLFTGLSNGTAYTFTVAATNGVGTGPGTTTGAVTPSRPSHHGSASTTATTTPAPAADPDPEADSDDAAPSTAALPPDESGDGDPSGGTVAEVDLGDGESISVTDDGQVITTDDADFHGDLADTDLNAPIVTIGIDWTEEEKSGKATTWQPTGYWLVASDGGVFAFGSARFYGSTGDLVLNQPIVGFAATPAGHGYWLVASDGGVFSFGDAHFHGSTGSMVLNQPIVGMAPTASGDGYWLAAADGGVFSFGDALFQGSGADTGQRFVGIARAITGRGYWLITADHTSLSYGDVS